MLVQLGTRRAEGADLVDLLLACHERIRRFVELACTLARAADRPADEVRDAAAQVRRYFAEALPLHVADEDEDLAPALAHVSPEVDAALAATSADHRDHEPALARLITMCAALEQSPQELRAIAPELEVIAQGLRAQFLEHLEREERVVFPALRRLPAAVQASLLARVRARRAA